VRLLLDTHVLLWHLSAPETLSREVAAEMARATDVAISAASLWEIGLKTAKGKLTVPDDLPEIIRTVGIRILPITAAHAWAVRSPAPSLATADPFDRLIYAQAMIEGLTLATRDRALLASGVAAIEA
jgi:PIN domain nuclease of toxin-antitoxin system